MGYVENGLLRSFYNTDNTDSRYGSGVIARVELCPPTCNPATPCGRVGCEAREHLRIDASIGAAMSGAAAVWKRAEQRARRLCDMEPYEPTLSGLGAIVCRMVGRR